MFIPRQITSWVLRLALVGAICLVLPRAAEAATFTFAGTSNGGVGSATMDIEVNGNDVVVTINNTSPIANDDGSRNIAAITGFGFNLDNSPLPTVTSWTLTAYAYLAGGDPAIGPTPETIASSSDSSLGNWSYDLSAQVQGSVVMDYLQSTVNPPTDGALYNPLLASTLKASDGNKDIYYTEAVLTITFAEEPVLSEEVYGNPSGQNSSNPFVRFQRVGIDEDGSLSLGPTDPGDPNEETPGVVPEPASLALWGIGLGLMGFGARRRLRKA